MPRPPPRPNVRCSRLEQSRGGGALGMLCKQTTAAPALPPGGHAAARLCCLHHPSKQLTPAPRYPPPAAGSPARRGLRQVPPSVCVDAPTPEGFTCEQQRSWGKVRWAVLLLRAGAPWGPHL